MGCKCCKMIQSYLCDPAQAPSPDYVNEVSSSNLDEDHTVKLKGQLSSEVLVHKNVLPSEGLRRTESRGWNAGPQEPSRAQQGSLPQEDVGCAHCAKPGGTANGIGPRASPQSLRKAQLGSWASTEESIHTALPFLEVRDSGSQDCVLPSLEETPAMGKGECRAPAEAQSPVWEGQGHSFLLPAPDYPPLWDLAAERHGDIGDEDEAVAEALAALEAATAGEDVDEAD
ncbi:uncharacterized protein C4orf19 homolog [Fukomys damarensis]|uniref:Uncharacterized protein n=1 Tax=Fukomys damarensis TaxID=885580 RepID=A0A091DSF6_FUKDA|nr:uncharacterized protein C4orf19 homolog [Fukomys damarensis]XP_010620711.1 uncharacterized protein C4orf19 homolog [Fukomys damarensis]XP_033614784.1 uncharacterized protein C4orf19 homolog [Fukomys damarensis]XP_033614785.1 uncharacterized protein C4orf19 homolog [Fukomys damarensis]KFO34037.1 hypothetical protein H920_04560 [Fukomys damarensis]